MKDLNERMRTARKLIEDHDNNRLNFYSFDDRMLLLAETGNIMASLADLNDPFQVGDAICALDNARIPFEFRPEVSAKLWRLKHYMFDLTPSNIHKAVVAHSSPKTVDDHVLELVLKIMEEGVNSETRTGVRSRAITSQSYTVDISNGQLPSISTKFNWNFGIKGELLWMLSGDTNVRFLKKHNIGIWDSWVKPGTEVYRDMTEEELFQSVKKLELVKNFEEVFNQAKETGVNRENALIHFLEARGHTTKYLIDGELPKIYQHQWRRWNDTRILEDNHELEAYEARGFNIMGSIGPKTVVQREIDQIEKIIYQLKYNPDDRGIILSAWNVSELEDMALRPCHTLCQFFSKPMTVRERLVWLGTYKPAGFEHLSEGMLELAAKHDDRRHETQYQNDATLRDLLEAAKVPTRKLSSQLYMRSNDVPLGHPFNVVQYAMLTHMVAQVTGHATDTFTWSGGDCHIYEDQWPAVLKWLEQEPVKDSHPTIRLNPNIKNIFDFKMEDIEVVGYKHAGKIEFPPAAV